MAIVQCHNPSDLLQQKYLMAQGSSSLERSVSLQALISAAPTTMVPPGVRQGEAKFTRVKIYPKCQQIKTLHSTSNRKIWISFTTLQTYLGYKM